MRALTSKDVFSAGRSVAVGVGSRGIGCIGEVVAAVVEELRHAGAEPFLVPAMGSHGGGTADGQAQVLRDYGLDEGRLDVPIRSSMDTVLLGKTDTGMPVFFDANAASADAIMVVNRVKPHTSFRGDYESGLCKMLAVGYGKERGAATLHAWGIADAIPAATRLILSHLPVLAGVAIVENGHHQPAVIEVVPATRLLAREPELLQEAWRHLPRIPFEPLDLLVLQEIGKDISGTGMDLNLTGMWRRNGGEVSPEIRVLAALDLTPASHGNAIGVGYCDLIPQRLRDKIEADPTYTNCLASGNFNGAKIPITVPTDRDLFRLGLPRVSPEEARVAIARNTLDVGTIWVSTALLPDVAASPSLTQVGPHQPLLFGDRGQLSLPDPD
jgi:hypothetical protein